MSKWLKDATSSEIATTDCKRCYFAIDTEQSEADRRAVIYQQMESSGHGFIAHFRQNLHNQFLARGVNFSKPYGSRGNPLYYHIAPNPVKYPHYFY
jgi:hypothetical protein